MNTVYHFTEEADKKLNHAALNTVYAIYIQKTEIIDGVIHITFDIPKEAL